MKAIAIIVAGGQGRRMQHTVSKQYMDLGGRPILSHTLIAFDACDAIESICVVVPRTDLDFCRESIITPLQMRTALSFVQGGDTRQMSVYNGIVAVGAMAEFVVIHDGVRPLIQPEMITATIEGAKQTGACILGTPATDTLKQINAQGIIEKTLPRHAIWLAQTPQTFAYDLIRKAHEAAQLEAVDGTDDAALVERIGHPVKIIKGRSSNIKITTPDDLKLAETILKNRLRNASET